jgi:hypothetical protein
MIGTKKLSTIRQEIAAALGSNGEDPLRWLEQQIAASKNKEAGGTEVLQGLLRILETPHKDKRIRGKRRTAKE